MTRADCTYEGPHLLSDLLGQIDEVKGRLDQMGKDHAQCQERLSSLEAEVQAIKGKEEVAATDLATAKGELAAARGRREGVQYVIDLAKGPALVALAWLLSMVWFAIRHAQIEEAEWRQQNPSRPPQQRPPNPPSQQKP
ncbi:MAG: hypothetical protein ACK41W_05570 [Cyanobacteriota bacterium]|jgi:transposase